MAARKSNKIRCQIPWAIACQRELKHHNQVFKPTYQPVQQPAAAQPKPTPAPAPVQPQTKTVTKTVSDCTSSGAINVPRNPNTNAPDYSQIQKGSYKGNTYKVNKRRYHVLNRLLDRYGRKRFGKHE